MRSRRQQQPVNCSRTVMASAALRMRSLMGSSPLGSIEGETTMQCMAGSCACVRKNRPLVPLNGTVKKGGPVCRIEPERRWGRDILPGYRFPDPREPWAAFACASMRGECPYSIGFLRAAPFFRAATARYAREMLCTGDKSGFRFAEFAGRLSSSKRGRLMGDEPALVSLIGKGNWRHEFRNRRRQCRRRRRSPRHQYRRRRSRR